jgi:peptide/nickel transport system substrate-binding protein
MKKLNLVLLIILSVSFIIYSCGRQKQETSETTETDTKETPLMPPDVEDAVQGDWIIQQELADAEKLNPIVSNDATASEICWYIFDKLLPVDRETYKLKPSVAKDMPEISEDKLIYTFDLRDDVNFSDGQPLTGDDVIFSMKVIKNPFTDAQARRNYFIDIKNVELVDGNKHKVRFTMHKPYYGAIYSIGDLEILPKHILDKDGVTDNFTFEKLEEASKTFDPEKYPELQKFADFINSQEVSRDPKYVVGSGPYKLEKWVTGQAITLTRNENYWNKDSIPSYPDKLIFKTIQDQTAALTAIKNGEIDNMAVIRNMDFVENLKNPEKYNLKKSIVGRPVYAYIAWNEERPFFADKKVRMALSHCVDRKTIVDKLLYGLAVPIQSHVYYKSEFLNKDLASILYDLEKAKQLLKEAGWEDTDGDGILDKVIDGKKVDFEFTFINNQNPSRKQILLVVIESFKKIGIEADIQDFEWSVFLDKLDKHEFDACYGGWVLSDTPPDPFQIFHSSQSSDEGSNYISYNNPESDKILVNLRTEFDEDKRKEMLYRWQEIIYEDQPYTFLWSASGKFATSDRFRNTRWYAHPYPHKTNEWWTSTQDQKYKKN